MKHPRDIRVIHEAIAALPDTWLANRRSRKDKVNPPRHIMVSYSRFSSEAQSENSVERQEALCAEYAARMGVQLAARYGDRARSGTTLLDRKGLEDMLAAARRGEFGILLVENVDRLARNLGILSTVFKELEGLGIEIHQPGRGKLGLTDIAFHGLMGDEGRRLFLDRCHYGRLKSAREGRIPNFSCYGYARVLGQPGERVIDEEQAVAIREIYQSRLDGMRPRQIAFFRNNRKDVDRTWTANGIVHILRNPLYNGVLVYNQCASTKNTLTGIREITRKPPEEWIITPVEHLRIVDRAIWEAVQTLIPYRTNDEARPATWHKYLLSGKVKCPSCGGSMSVRGYCGDKQRRFVCTNYGTTRTCKSHKTIKVDDLEDFIIDLVANKVLDPRCTEAYVAAYNAERQKSRHNNQLTRERLQRELDRLNGELKDTFKKALTVGLTTETIFEMRQELNAEVAKVNGKLKAMPLTPRPVGLDEGRMRTLREAVGDMRLNLPFQPQDEAGVLIAASFRELIERIVIRRTGFDSFEADVTLTVVPLLAGDSGTVDDGSDRMHLRASFSRKSRAYAATDVAQADLARLADGHYGLRENEWDAVRHIVPEGLLRRRRGGWDARSVLEAHLFVLMTGSPWPALPASFGKSVDVYFVVSKLIAHGVWREVALTLASIDPVRYKPDYVDASGKTVKVYEQFKIVQTSAARLSEAA